MKKIFLLAIFALFSIGLLSFSVNAHPSKKHKPLVCIPEEERSKQQLAHQRWVNFAHRLTKLQQDCAMIEIEKQKKRLKLLENWLLALLFLLITYLQRI